MADDRSAKRAKVEPGDEPDDTFTIRVKDQTGEELFFRVRPSTNIRSVTRAWTSRKLGPPPTAPSRPIVTVGYERLRGGTSGPARQAQLAERAILAEAMREQGVAILSLSAELQGRPGLDASARRFFAEKERRRHAAAAYCPPETPAELGYVDTLLSDCPKECFFHAQGDSACDLPEGLGPEADILFAELDTVARDVLEATAAGLGVHSLTFSGLLDDRPLPPATPSVSQLRSIRYERHGGSYLACEAHVDKGVLSLVLPPAEAPATSALEVQDPNGFWSRLELQSNEVAVVAGHTLHVASDGQVRDALHRVAWTAGAEGRLATVFVLRGRRGGLLGPAVAEMRQAAQGEAGQQPEGRSVGDLMDAWATSHVSAFRAVHRPRFRFLLRGDVVRCGTMRQLKMRDQEQIDVLEEQCGD